MGLGGEPVETHPAQPRARSATIGPELERLHGDVRRLERMTWGLAAAVVVLAVLVVYLLVR